MSLDNLSNIKTIELGDIFDNSVTSGFVYSYEIASGIYRIFGRVGGLNKYQFSTTFISNVTFISITGIVDVPAEVSTPLVYINSTAKYLFVGSTKYACYFDIIVRI